MQYSAEENATNIYILILPYERYCTIQCQQKFAKNLGI